MELKISNNAFLGKVELDRLKTSIIDEGYKDLVQKGIATYGVVHPYTDSLFTSLKVVQGSTNNFITVNPGDAVDSSLNVSKVESILVDHLGIPADSADRWVSITYLASSIEDGTVAITADGLLTGTDTKFTECLRGLPDYPSKITFNSGTNTQEYTVASVTSDTLAQLNVLTGSMTPESLKTMEVVGTFTPGVSVPTGDKYPFIRDSYTIKLNNSDALAANEYHLAKVSNDGSTLSVTDLRSTNLYSVATSSTAVDSVSPINPLIAPISERFQHKDSDGSDVRTEIEWAFQVQTADWSYNASTQQITITAGNGGSFANTTDFTTGDFDGWLVKFHSDFTTVNVLTSTLVVSDIVLDVSFLAAAPTGALQVYPNADFVEILATRYVATEEYNEIFTFPATAGNAFITSAPQKFTQVFWRHTRGIASTNYASINDNTYTAATSYDEDGILGTVATTATLSGNIYPTATPRDVASYKQPRGLATTVITNAGGIIDLTSTANYKDRNSFTVACDTFTIDAMTELDPGTTISLTLIPGAVTTAVLVRPNIAAGAGYKPMRTPLTLGAAGRGALVGETPTLTFIMARGTAGGLEWKLIGSTDDSAYNSSLAPAVSPYTQENFTSSNISSSGVISGLSGAMRYNKVGTTVHIFGEAAFTLGSDDPEILITLPGGLQHVTTGIGNHTLCRLDTGGSIYQMIFAYIDSGATYIKLRKTTAGTDFVAGSNTINFSITFEVN